MDYDGREVARWDAGSPILASPAVGREHVHVMTAQGALHALRADTLAPVWKEQVAADGPTLSSPTLARGRVYVGSSGGGLYCLGSTAPPRAPVWAGDLGGPGCGGSIGAQPVPARGVFAWRYPGGEGEAAAHVVAPAAVVAGRLVVPIAEGPGPGIVCLRADGARRGGAEEVWTFAAPGGVWESPAATERHVFVISGAPGADERALCALDAETGAEAWHRPIGGVARAHLNLADNDVFVQASPDALVSFDLTGREQWRRPVGVMSGPPHAADDILVVAVEKSEAGPALFALDRPLGVMLWRATLDSPPCTGPVVVEATIYVGVSGGVEARRLVDGALLWRSDAGAPVRALAVEGGLIVYVSADGRFIALDRRTGGTAIAAEGALRAWPPVVSRGAALFAAADGIRRLDLNDGEARRWMQTAWLGEMTAPMVLADSALYFATRPRGLVCARGRE